MPIYEFECDACNQPCELLLRGDEKPACPDCGSVKLTKQFSVPAAHNNGSADLPMAGGDCGRPQCGMGG